MSGGPTRIAMDDDMMPTTAQRVICQYATDLNRMAAVVDAARAYVAKHLANDIGLGGRLREAVLQLDDPELAQVGPVRPSWGEPHPFQAMHSGGIGSPCRCGGDASAAVHRAGVSPGEPQ